MECFSQQVAFIFRKKKYHFFCSLPPPIFPSPALKLDWIISPERALLQSLEPWLGFCLPFLGYFAGKDLCLSVYKYLWENWNRDSDHDCTSSSIINASSLNFAIRSVSLRSPLKRKQNLEIFTEFKSTLFLKNEKIFFRDKIMSITLRAPIFLLLQVFQCMSDNGIAMAFNLQNTSYFSNLLSSEECFCIVTYDMRHPLRSAGT